MNRKKYLYLFSLLACIVICLIIQIRRGYFTQSDASDRVEQMSPQPTKLTEFYPVSFSFRFRQSEAKTESFTAKQVALTFDDGPNEIYTPRLLDGLKERDVRSTFFLLGKEAEQYPDLVHRLKEEGHEIGCHSYEHLDFSKLSAANACEQIERTCKLLQELTGERPIMIRPPFGSWKPCLDESICMIEVLWNVDPLDWATADSDAVVNRILQKVQDGDIILMHDASQSSVDAALKVIDALQKDGYEFVTVSELMLP